MRLNAFIFACGLVLVAAGCATKKPPKRAEIQGQSLAAIPLTNAWTAAGAKNGVIQDNWLATFDDPQLMALVDEAITNNPDLKIASVQVERAAAQVDLAKSYLRPAVRVLGTGGINGSGGGDASSALQALSLGVSWEPDLWGRLRYGRNAAQSTYASAQADFEFGRQSLAAAVARAWFLATETLLQQGIADQMVKASKELLSVADKRNSIGSGTEQDVAIASANARNFEDGSKQTRLAHEQSIRALELLLGRYPAAELAARKKLIVLKAQVPAGLPLEMLERRPDMIAAERRVAAAFHRVGEAKAARLPRISLSASVGVLESDVLQLKEDFQNPSASAGAYIFAPIYQGGGLRAQVKIRTLEQKQAVAEYAQMALRAIGDVENALSTSRNLAEREKILRDLVAQNKRALDLTEKSYRIGKSDLADVQQRQIDVNSSTLNLLRVQSEVLSQRVNLHLALGGGFKERPLETASTEKPNEGRP